MISISLSLFPIEKSLILDEKQVLFFKISRYFINRFRQSSIAMTDKNEKLVDNLFFRIHPTLIYMLVTINTKDSY